jgi:hypothetical protein
MATRRILAAVRSISSSGRRSTLTVLVAVSAALAACGSSSGSPTTAASTTPTSTTSRTAPPTTSAATTTTTSPGPTSSQLAGELLSVTDLPAGWTSTLPQSSGGGSICGSSNDLKSTASGHAEADFTNGNLPIFDELISGYSSPPTQLFAKGITQLGQCHSFKANGATLTLGTMSFPTIGSESAALSRHREPRRASLLRSMWF